jgi:hypothetical protein
MNEQDFKKFLKKGGRSPSAIKRAVAHVKQFEQHLQARQPGQELDAASPQDLQSFVAWVESSPKTSAKTHLWALCYYFEYSANEEMRRLAGELRQQRIKRKPFALDQFRGVNPAHAQALARAGIEHVEHMLKAGRTPGDRQALAQKTGLPPEAILEFVKLSDLARLPGVKGIRARLYYDAGVDTVEKMARWEPEALRAMLVEFVARTGFDGIAPLPKEARDTVTSARKLPRVVEC